jgi:pimeloyl-ACP methyl ester carboxylesterase
MENFSITNRRGLKIVGDLSIPKDARGLSFVLHGLGGYKDQFHIKMLADVLYNNDFIVVNFDATNSIGESEGKYEDATMQFHYDDLVDVISWAKGQSWYIEPFVLVGHSLGGFAITNYAEEFPNEVKAIFPHAAVFSGEDSFEASEKFKIDELKSWKESGWTHRKSTSKPGTEMKLPWSHMEERLKHDLKPNANKLSMPLLFVVGENDTSCPPYQQQNFCNLLPNNTIKEFHIVKNAPHTFREAEHLGELKNIFNHWLKNLK